MELGDRKLVLGRLAGTVAAGNGTGTERPATVDLAEAAELLGLEADRDVDDAVVREEGYGGECRSLLATVLGAGGDEDGRELLALWAGVSGWLYGMDMKTYQGLSEPETAGSIEECADLRGGATVTGRDCQKQAFNEYFVDLCTEALTHCRTQSHQSS